MISAYRRMVPYMSDVSVILCNICVERSQTETCSGCKCRIVRHGKETKIVLCIIIYCMEDDDDDD